MSEMNHNLKRNGFTLLETAVAMGIMLIVLSGIIVLFRYGFTSRTIIMEQLLTQTEGRKIVQDFVNELRSATLSSIGAYTIEKATTTEFIFFTNRDTDSYKERVRYFLSETDLKKGITKPSGSPLSYNTSTESIAIIAHDVLTTSTPIFVYYDENYDGASSTEPLAYPIALTQIRVVKIQLGLEENPNMSPTPFFVEAVGQVRNLKDN
jgi:prepilin-type N-terminal cleavage/methylation domain-containing protein